MTTTADNFLPANQLNKSTARHGTWLAKCFKPRPVHYSYFYNSKEVNAVKVQVILLTTDPQEYFLGVVKIRDPKSDEVQKAEAKFKADSVWTVSYTHLTLPTIYSV